MVQILPSLLSADFARLAQEITSVEAGGASMLHLDVMDGHFVPNITFGTPVVESIRAATDLKLDVHLMIEHPERFIRDFVRAGADSISVHRETCAHLHGTLRMIQAEGILAGVVINPATPVIAIEEVLDFVDFVLVMSVNPGFGGQQFIPRTLAKILELQRRRRELGLNFPIEIDGGVNLQNLAEIVRAGADWIVAGSSVFHSDDPGLTVRQMQELAREATAIRV
ncbi:MAG: ribulose-phosphate 3-epimerase [Acidimicrobiia bacterium]|nr:ribulose-phosphate 3-epimerase [Acidimicrobiia bacterium]